MQVLLGLGANLGDPPRAFAAALAALGPAARTVAVSRLYRGPAEGPPQPDYWNAVALLEARVPPLELLALCLELERRAGRVRRPGGPAGPRPLDLDLVLVPGVVCRGPRLELPHPRCHRRAFVMVPAAEVVPDWIHPLLGRTVARLAASLAGSGLAPLPDGWRPAALRGRG